MKRLAVLSTVVALAALALFATSSAQSTEVIPGEPAWGVMYDDWDGQHHGLMSVANGEGNFIEVFAADGELVWCGVVPANYFEFDCANRGIGRDGELLWVRAHSGTTFCIDRDEDWIWD